MLLYRDGRFYRAGISFAIPNEFYLAGAGDEDGIEIWHPRKCYSLDFEIVYECSGTREYFDEVMSREYIPLMPIRPIQINGLFGHQYAYSTRGRSEEYYEIRFAIGDSPERGKVEFVLVLLTYDNNLFDIVDSEEFQNILRSIRREKA